MIATIASRIGFVLLGYVAAVVSGTVAFLCVLALISLLIPGSSLWGWLGLGPVAMFVAPVIAVLVFYTLVVVTFAQAFIAHAVTEYFALRSIFVHLAIAMAVAFSGGLSLLPGWYSEMGVDKWLVTLAALVAALAGGAVYWAIAGRKAGLRADGAA